MINIIKSKIITNLSLAFIGTVFQTSALIASTQDIIGKNDTQPAKSYKSSTNVTTAVKFIVSLAAITQSSAINIQGKFRNPYLKKVNILSIDGSISGDISALTFLDALEKHMGKNEKEGIKPTSKIFDMVAGASSGCLAGAVLTQPRDSSVFPWQPLYTAGEYIEIKKTESKQIFSKFRLLPTLFDPKGPGILYSTYFKDENYSTSIIPRVAQIFDLKNLESIVISSEDENTYKATDLVLASTAFPIVFPPKTLSPSNNPAIQKIYIDGATLDINPAYNALIKARELFPCAEEFRLVSLGSGIKKGSKISSAASKDIFTVLEILVRLLKLNVSPYEANIDYALSAGLGSKNFMRFTPEFNDINAILGFDFNAVEASTKKYLKEHPEILENTAKMLSK